MIFSKNDQRRVLLIDRDSRRQQLRAAALRNCEVEVHPATSLMPPVFVRGVLMTWFCRLPKRTPKKRPCSRTNSRKAPSTRGSSRLST